MFWKNRNKKKEENRPEIQEIGKTEEFIEAPGMSVKFHDMNVLIQIGNAQHIGGRAAQEDSFAFSDLTDDEKITEKGICAVLSDGMGGLTDGRKVSEYTISESLAFFSRLILEEPVWQQMETFVRSMNQQVCEAYAKNGKPGAGATLILLLIHHDRAYWCTVGDSRLYLIRRGRLYQINEDHDYRNQLLGQYISGQKMTLEQAFRDGQGSALASYIGCPQTGKIETSIRGLPLQDSDRLLLMSDGVYRALSEEEILNRKEEAPQKMCEHLLADAADKHLAGQDNMTLLVLEYKWQERETEA